MISKAALCHILVIWGLLAQVMAQLNRGSIPAGVRSSMIANGWRPLTGYDGKNNGPHSPGINGVVSMNERHSGPHPVHGKLQEHLAKSEKLTLKQNKQAHDYNPPSILGSFSVFGHSMAKVRGSPESSKSHVNQVASETREFSFLVPPPREPARYDIDPYRKVIIRDNDAYLRQPQQYIISHPGGPSDLRNTQYFPKGSAAVSASTHTLTTTKNRPLITDYNGAGVQQPLRQQPQQQHVTFESLKLSNAKLYLQPPSGNAPSNFAQEQQQATGNLYERYPSSLLTHGQQLSPESSGNFYSQINHPSPYKSQILERDPAFLVHESHEISYGTPLPPSQSSLGSYGNFRPSSPYESLHPPERYSTLRPTVPQTEKFVPSKTDNIRQKQENYGQYGQNSGNTNFDNSIVSSEPAYSNGIVNTYYISEQQGLTPPAPTWSVPAKNKVTPDINEVLPKANRPAKFNIEPANAEGIRQNQQNNVPNFLFPRPDVQQQKQKQQQVQQQNQQLQQHHQQLQQQYYANNPLPLINQQPETFYETPESISLKHFNDQQYKLQQQLLQRDRDILREQELQRQQQQIELERIEATREREKDVTTVSRPIAETPRPTVEYIDTTVTYANINNQGDSQEIRKLPGQQYIQQEYQDNLFEFQRPDAESPVIYEAENISAVPDIYAKVTSQPETTVNYESSEVPTTVHRNRARKPTAGNVHEQHRRKKPTTPLYEEKPYRQEEQYHFSTLDPKPIVQSPGSLYSHSSTTETPTTAFKIASLPSVTSVTSGSTKTTTPTATTTTTSTTTTTTTQRPRTRRPSSGNLSNGRRRRPTTTTTQDPETVPPVTYRQEDYTKYEKTETESSRRRRIKPSSVVTQTHYEIEPNTSTEKKRFEIQNYGHKLGTNEQDYVTESSESYSGDVGQVVSSQQSHAYGNEQDSLFYTPTYESQVTTGQESTDYETPGYPTSSTSLLTHSSPTEPETIDNTEIGKNVYTNIPLEELFVNTERSFTTTPVSTTTTTTTTTTPRPTTAVPTRNSHIRTTGIPVTSAEILHTTRASSHRMRPMRFGNSTRPRFSIKDYKSRLDYRNRMSTTSETPNVTSRQKTASSKIQQEIENQPVESTTGRYRLMSRASYRITSTTPSHHSRRGDSGESTTERINKFTPKRRMHNNHLYRSKITTSTTTPQSSDEDSDVTTSSTTRQNSVRNENVYSSSIRRRPQMKHAVFTQSSDIRTTRKDSTELIPEETSFYSPAISQLLVTDSSSVKNNEQSDHYVTEINEVRENGAILTSTSQNEATSSVNVPLIGNYDNLQPIRVQDSNVFEYSQATTTTSPSIEVGQTEALVKEAQVTVDSQLEEDLFARASQSVADLTSSASALYDKPGMFKAVSVAPSASEGSAIISSRFKISQDKPTLPIEAFFHELSNKN